MNEASLIHQFQTINVWKKAGERAVHKPLLILYALGRCQRDESRLIGYNETNETFQSLMEAFGPSRKTYTSYPFFYLQSDGLWELESTSCLTRTKQSKAYTHSSLVKNNTLGGMPKEIFSYLQKNKDLIPQLAQTILDGHFPETLHNDILLAVGITPSIASSAKTVRDPKFREQVLEAYEYKCAICGYNLRVGQRLVGLEAAHIKWHHAGGPDIQKNGIALCSMHHKLFDYGAFTLSDQFTVEVSRRAHGDFGKAEWLMNYQGKQIRCPQSDLYFPEPEFLHWHVREVFKSTYRP